MSKPRIGLSLSSSLSADSPAKVAAMMVERTTAAYDAGLSSLSVGDHHGQPSWYMQNTPTLGRLLAEWPDRPAGCLFLLPLWNPLLVAEHVGTLAAMVDAPFIVQVGIGTGARQFASFGADLTRRGRDTDEAIEVIQALLGGETAASERLGMAESSLALRPAQAVEWWIGGHAEATLSRAAELGTAWYGGPGLSRDESVALIDGYRRACQAAATTPRAIVRRDVLVLEDADRARAEATSLVEAGYRGLTLEQLLVGDAGEVATSIEALGQLGYDDVIVRTMTPNQDDALETITLLGDIQRG